MNAVIQQDTATESIGKDLRSVRTELHPGFRRIEPHEFPELAAELEASIAEIEARGFFKKLAHAAKYKVVRLTAPYRIARLEKRLAKERTLA